MQNHSKQQKLEEKSIFKLFKFRPFDAFYIAFCGCFSLESFVQKMCLPVQQIAFKQLPREILTINCCFLTQIGHYTTMFPEFLFLCCVLTSFIFLSASSLSLQLDVARYACVTKASYLLGNKTTSVQALITDWGLTVLAAIKNIKAVQQVMKTIDNN